MTTNPSPDVEALINALYPVEGQLWISVGAARLAIANWLRTQTPDPTARAGVAGEIERACRALLFDSNDVDPDVAVQAATSTILGFISASPPPPGSGELRETVARIIDPWAMNRAECDPPTEDARSEAYAKADEILAFLQASLTAANSREERLREAIEKAAAKFEEYALSHFKKQTAEGDEKALTNATMASELRAVLKSGEAG